MPRTARSDDDVLHHASRSRRGHVVFLSKFDADSIVTR